MGGVDSEADGGDDEGGYADAEQERQGPFAHVAGL